MMSMRPPTEPFKVKQKLWNQATLVLVLVRSKPHPTKQLCVKQFVWKVLHHPQKLNLIQMQYFLVLLRQISNISVESHFLTFQHTGRAALALPALWRTCSFRDFICVFGWKKYRFLQIPNLCFCSTCCHLLVHIILQGTNSLMMTPPVVADSRSLQLFCTTYGFIFTSYWSVCSETSVITNTYVTCYESLETYLTSGPINMH